MLTPFGGKIEDKMLKSKVTDLLDLLIERVFGNFLLLCVRVSNIS